MHARRVMGRRTRPHGDGRLSSVVSTHPGHLIAQAIIPVMLFIGAGFILRRRLTLDLRPISRVALYVFSPALVFGSLISPQLSGHDMFGIIVFATVMVIVSLAISRVTGWMVHARRQEQAGLDLAAVFSNSANLGLPLVAFGLGGASLHAAVIFVLTQIVAVNTIGAYLAGRGGIDPRAAFRRMARLPSLWAMGIAVIVGGVHLTMPSSLLTAAQFGGQAYAPTVLVVLGGTLADWQQGDLKRPLAWVGAGLRLLVMPVIALMVVTALSLSPHTAHALVLQIAMPVAVNALILAQEFDAVPGQVSQSIALSTLGGILTIPFWLALIPFVH